MESLGYMFVYFARGSLPWQGLKAGTDEERNSLLRDKKSSLSGEDLCRDVLPQEFAEYINYTRSLGFRDKPGYGYLRKLFRNRFRREGFHHDHVFDWTERRFHEICGEIGRQKSRGSSVDASGQKDKPMTCKGKAARRMRKEQQRKEARA
jgi:casein kinase 1 delta/casein kinase I family protein HRR25